MILRWGQGWKVCLSEEVKHPASSQAGSLKGALPVSLSTTREMLLRAEEGKGQITVASPEDPRSSILMDPLGHQLPGLGSHCYARVQKGWGIPRCLLPRPCFQLSQSLAANILKTPSIWSLWAAGEGDIHWQSCCCPYFQTEVFTLREKSYF